MMPCTDLSLACSDVLFILLCDYKFIQRPPVTDGGNTEFIIYLFLTKKPYLMWIVGLDWLHPVDSQVSIVANADLDSL